MYNYVLKVGGESVGQSKSLLLKEVSFQVSLESISCGYFAQREGKGVSGDSGGGREGARADSGQFGARNLES